jgi:tetratricopeptide (TPR) repeat protein
MRELRRALELNPNDVNANHWYAIALGGVGRFDEALAQMQRARDVDPLAVMIHANVGFTLCLAGRISEAVAHLRQTVALEPGFVMSRYRLGVACEACGLYDEALEQFHAMNPSEQDPLGYAGIARTLARMGREAAAREELARILAIARITYVPAALIAGVHLALGDAERTFEHLDRAIEERGITSLLMPLEHDWRQLHGDPRHARVLERIGLKG